MKTATIGTVIHATLRSEDLIPAFLDVLADLDMAKHDSIRDEYGYATGFDYDSEEASEMVVALEDALSELAPPYCYFGTTEGDGSDFGFWPSIDSLEEDARLGDGVLKVSDLADVPDDATGYVMHVSDHGNVTLYEVEIPAKVYGFRKASDNLHEIWSVV